MLHNDLTERLSLNGLWQFQLNGSQPCEMNVPSAWELTAHDMVTDGPARYSRHFAVPDQWIGSLIILEAMAISYAATVRINHQFVGQHSGMWSPFQMDVTRFITSGENLIEIEVWKPGKRYPLHQCLAGFLPDVATTFGGIWQSIQLRRFPPIAVSNIRFHSAHNGEVKVDGVLITAKQVAVYRGELTVSLDGDQVGNAPLTIARNAGVTTLNGEVKVPEPRKWGVGPSQPSLYDATVTLYEIHDDKPLVSIKRRIGFRSITSERDRLLLNNQPLHLRGVLDWGWNADRVCPTPERAEVLDQIQKARQLGFNMVKLCLYMPDETTFDIADETHTPIWLELPMWLPDVTPAFKQQALAEYNAILARVHHHPSICIISLGCELSQQVDAGFLQELSGVVHRWLPNILLCDNSGSAEAYNGTATNISDFHDYHFYTDPHFFHSLVDHFSRAYQPPKPWIYGEFCDADTLRDYSTLTPAPWWLSEPVSLDREELHWVRDYAKLLQVAGISDSGAALTQSARQQATAIRKFIFEQVRSRHAMGGYVITGWKDTPISTSGIVDDDGELKYAPAEWRQFNNDRILIIDRERHRIWHGGDRPKRLDPYTFWQDEKAEIHVALSNGSTDVTEVELEIRCNMGSQSELLPLAKAPYITSVPGGEVVELATCHLPGVTPNEDAISVQELRFNATFGTLDGIRSSIENAWRLWQVPHRTRCLQAIQRGRIENRLTDRLRHSIFAGEKAVIWLDAPDERFTQPMPFWREAIHVFRSHPLWSRLLNPPYADMRFYSVANDYAIDSIALANYLGSSARVTPVWRRFDARRMTWADYIVEVAYGEGRFIMSTLRFAGGSGYQPDSLATNPIGAWILKSLLELL